MYSANDLNAMDMLSYQKLNEYRCVEKEVAYYRFHKRLEDLFGELASEEQNETMGTVYCQESARVFYGKVRAFLHDFFFFSLSDYSSTGKSILFREPYYRVGMVEYPHTYVAALYFHEKRNISEIIQINYGENPYPFPEHPCAFYPLFMEGDHTSDIYCYRLHQAMNTCFSIKDNDRDSSSEEPYHTPVQIVGTIQMISYALTRRLVHIKDVQEE